MQFVRRCDGADLFSDVVDQSFFMSSEALKPSFRSQRRRCLALDVMGLPHDRRFRNRRMETSALSISAVPSRWPETLITSSTRPMRK